MITETQTRIIVLQLTDELTEQLQPFLAGLGVTITSLQLTMRVEVYVSLTERVGSTLDYEVRWQPNKYDSEIARHVVYNQAGTVVG
jgi:hypothetical protein